MENEKQKALLAAMETTTDALAGQVYEYMQLAKPELAQIAAMIAATDVDAFEVATAMLDAGLISLAVAYHVGLCALYLRKHAADHQQAMNAARAHVGMGILQMMGGNGPTLN